MDIIIITIRLLSSPSSFFIGLIVGHGIFNRKSLNSTLKSARRSVTESGMIVMRLLMMIMMMMRG